MHFNKKADLNTYYSLSAAKGNVDSRPFGDPTLLTGPDKFLLTGTNAAVDYPETVSRNHQLVAIFRYKLTKNLTSKVEYRYQQFDSKDYQTSAMTPVHGLRQRLAAGSAGSGVHKSVTGYAQSVLSILSGRRYQRCQIFVFGRRPAVVPGALSRGNG